jgi:predicted RNase H-like HicB family nuclease
MKPIDQYHRWVEWSDEDQVYIGKCPDLITGIHGDDPKKVYADLCQVVEEVIAHFESEGRPLPPPTVRPMQEVL